MQTIKGKGGIFVVKYEEEKVKKGDFRLIMGRASTSLVPVRN
jgi:hypothetical protein